MRCEAITDQEALGLEHDDWEAIKTRDGRTAARMTAVDCTVVGASRVMGVDPMTIGVRLPERSYAGGREVETDADR